MKHFAHLHVHSEYSILKGIGEIKSWYEAAAKRGISALAFTEYGNMNSAMASYLQSLDTDGVKAIFGMQTLVVQDVHATMQEEPIILLAKNETGYKNLLQLNNWAWINGFDSKRQTARVGYEQLYDYRKGLFALTGSLSGPVAMASEVDFHIAERAIYQLKEIFGKRLYLELQLNDVHEQKIYNNKLIRLSHNTNVEIVITNDCHYPNKGEHKLADVVEKIDRMSIKSSKRGRSFDSTQKWLKSYKQLNIIRNKLHAYITLTDFNKYVSNTNKIAEQCNVSISIGKHSLPQYDIKSHPMYEDDMKDDKDLFNKIAKTGFRSKIIKSKKRKNNKKKYLKQFKYEVDIIGKANFINYFLIVEDIIRYARVSNIEVGAARGSVAGSLVAFCMGITDVDPFEFDLMFERFLNPTRISGERAQSADALPDIDLDFERVRRPEIKKYLVEKYGEDRVCTIGSYQTMKLKSLLRDLHRAFEHRIPDETGYYDYSNDELFALIRKLDKDKIDDLDKALNKSEAFKEFYKRFPYFVDFYLKKLDGQIRSRSKHAAGVIVTPTSISDWIPIRTQKVEDEEERVAVSQWEDTFCERRGLLKLDVLGIKTLNVFKRARELILKRRGKKIDLSKVRLDDQDVFDEFDAGKTEGVFQFNSHLQSQYLKRLDVTEFEDLITTNALLRPGPMDAKAHELYIELKSGERKPKYDHPMIEPYLRRTYGLYVYQEDVMRTAHVLGKLTLAEADIMRTAMKKHDKDQMEAFREKFVKGCVENGLKKKHGNKVWDKLLAFFAYGFNRCIHAFSEITLSNGKKRRISRLYNDYLKGKEIVLKSYDIETGKIVDNVVEEIVYTGKKNLAKFFLQDGKNIRLTSRHGIGTDRGFRLMKDIINTDLIWILNGSEAQQVGVDAYNTFYDDRYKEDTYDIVMVNKPHNYFANDILVHNSHSASYALIGYLCQWLKVYYPLEYWSATLEYAADDEKKSENIWTFRSTIIKYGYQFERPRANRSDYHFSISKRGRIIWPIRAIKGVGVKSAIAIAQACKEHKPKTLVDFYNVVPKRSANKRVFNKLITSGAFDNFGTPYEIAKEYYEDIRREEIPKELNVPSKRKAYWMKMRESVLGYMEKSFQQQFSHWFSKSITPVSELANIPSGKYVISGGKVKRSFPYNARTGWMFFVTVYDLDGEFLLMITPEYYKRHKKKVKEGDIIEVLGRCGRSKRGEIQITLGKDKASQLEVYDLSHEI